MVHTPCNLPLRFPVTVWTSFSVQLKFLHRVVIAGSTEVFWTQIPLSP